MVMGHLPRAGFALMDVRDAMLDGELLSRKLDLPLLDARFVGQIPRDPDQLISQRAWTK